MPLANYLAQARIADQYRQALRDAAILPAIHYDLACARIADVHHQAHRIALARAARRGRRERARRPRGHKANPARGAGRDGEGGCAARHYATSHHYP